MTDYEMEAKDLYAYATSSATSMAHIGAAYIAIERHWRKGRYDRAKARPPLVKVARGAALAYTRDYGGPGARWELLFPMPARERLVDLLLDDLERELAAGNSYLGGK